MTNAASDDFVVVGINDYVSPGEAAKSTCIFAGAAFADGAWHQPYFLLHAQASN